MHACAAVSTPVQRVAAEQALKAFQEHPEAWTRVDSILEKAKTQQTKYFALQVSTPPPAAHWHVQLPGLVSDAVDCWTTLKATSIAVAAVAKAAAVQHSTTPSVVAASPKPPCLPA